MATGDLQFIYNCKYILNKGWKSKLMKTEEKAKIKNSKFYW